MAAIGVLGPGEMMLWMRVLLYSWVVAVGGCSLLVDPFQSLIKCEVRPGEPDPCADLGLSCIANICQECKGAREDCNGIRDWILPYGLSMKLRISCLN